MSCVDDLVQLVGLDKRTLRTFDWETIERSLGLRLPDDYRMLAEITPLGRFQGFVRLIRPGDFDHPESEYLGYYEYRLEDMRAWREEEPERFPFPIYPEPGGLLPWAATHRHDLIFWLTADNDPNEWPVVTSDTDFSHFTPIAGNACDFLTQVVTGRFDARSYELDLASQDPWFEMRPTRVETGPKDPEHYWLDQQLYSAHPENKYRELARQLGEPAPGHAQRIDWEYVERRLERPLPSDYKSFIEKYGPGMLGDVRIFSPSANRPDFDLFLLLNRIEWRFADDNRRRQTGPPIFPERGGLIAWGETSDNRICAWAPSRSDDAGAWGVVTGHDDLRIFSYRWDQSFSSLLLDYTDLSERDPIGFRDVARPEPVVFAPSHA